MTYPDVEKHKKELKFKTMSDDPKYVYVDLIENNLKKKLHKSNLFVNIRKQKEYK